MAYVSFWSIILKFYGLAWWKVKPIETNPEHKKRTYSLATPWSNKFLYIPAYLLGGFLFYLFACTILLWTGLARHIPDGFFWPLLQLHNPEQPWRFWNPIGIFG